MTREKVLQQIRKVALVPVLRATSADLAIKAAAAIEAGGVSLLEVTMTVPGAIDVISHEAPTVWMRLPKFETRLAVQISEKMRE